MRLEIFVLRKKIDRKIVDRKKKVGQKKLVEFFWSVEKKLVDFFFGLEKNFRLKKKVDRKKKWSKKFSSPKKKSWSIFFFGLEKKCRSKKKVDRKKKLVEKNFESEKCWSKILLVGRKKKVEKIDNFVNFGVSLTFFVVNHSGRPGPKRVSTVIPNSILLVDSR